MFDGRLLFTVMLLLMPLITIVIGLFKYAAEREIIREILGRENFDWLIEQYKIKQEYKQVKILEKVVNIFRFTYTIPKRFFAFAYRRTQQ